MTPREHLRRLTNVRKQIVTETGTSSGQSADSTPTNPLSPAAANQQKQQKGGINILYWKLYVVSNIVTKQQQQQPKSQSKANDMVLPSFSEHSEN